MMGSKLFDAHCHLQLPRAHVHADLMLRRAASRGVSRVACCGCSQEDWAAVEALAARHPETVAPCFGLHPWWRPTTKDWCSQLESVLRRHPRAPVGEIGLDSTPRALEQSGQTPGEQEEAFLAQLRLAKLLNRPAVIHCVRSHSRLLSLCRAEAPFPAGLMLHSFSGSASTVDAFVKLNAYISFSSVILNERATKLRRAVAVVPLDRLLVESDAPDQLFLTRGEREVASAPPAAGGAARAVAPSSTAGGGEEAKGGADEAEGRGSASAGRLVDEEGREVNEPGRVALVVEEVARIRGVAAEEVAAATWSNACRLLWRAVEDDVGKE